MQADFARSLKLVLVDEGGLSDDPHDHGGRTAHGIIQREYDAFRARKGLPHQDVWRITPAEVTEIYHDHYWEPWCDQLPAGFDYVFFDFDVNAGPAQATRTLQRILKVRPDGHMGPVTLEAVRNADTQKLIHAYCDARRAFYRHNAQFARYGRGWMARTNHVERAANEIYATGETVRAPVADHLRDQASARAKAEDTAQPPATPEASGGVAGATGVAAGVADKLRDMSDQLSPFQGVFRFVEYALLAIAVVSVGFMLYGMWQRSRVKEAVA